MIEVTCAIIEQYQQQEHCVLVCQRSEKMSLPLKWEFPGGKIEPGENPQACLAREIQEELHLKVEVGQPLKPVRHRYPLFEIRLFPFRCRITGGEIHLSEHRAFLWQPLSALHQLDWAQADRPIVLQLQKL